MPLPIYNIDQSSVLVCLFPSGAHSYASPGSPAPVLPPPEINDERKQKLLDFISEHPEAIYEDMAQCLLTSERTVGNLMRELVASILISRSGSRKKRLEAHPAEVGPLKNNPVRPHPGKIIHRPERRILSPDVRLPGICSATLGLPESAVAVSLLSCPPRHAR